MESINKILKDYRVLKGMSLDELSKMTGIPKSTLNRYENNSSQKIDIRLVMEIARALEIPKSEVRKNLFDEVFWDDNPVKVPVVGRVCAGAGIIAEEEILGYETVEEKYGNDDYFCLQVKGDSMSPRIDHGDIVLVKEQNYVENGELAIVIVDSEDGLIKKVEYGEELIKLISFNPYYPERIFEKDDMNRVRVVGKVIESKRKW